MVLAVFLFFIIFFKEKGSFLRFLLYFCIEKVKNKNQWTHYTYFNLHV